MSEEKQTQKPLAEILEASHEWQEHYAVMNVPKRCILSPVNSTNYCREDSSKESSDGPAFESVLSIKSVTDRSTGKKEIKEISLKSKPF